jgi:hypothetical protein
MSEVVKSESRGRKVNPNSARQQRLAAWEAKRSAGIEVKRGRPAKSAPVVKLKDSVLMNVNKAMEKSSKKKAKKAA